MNPLKLNQIVLTFVGVCAVEENTPNSKRIRISLFYALMVVMHVINIAACSLYFIKYISIDYDGAIYAFLAATVLCCLLYILINLRYHSAKLRFIFSTLHEIRNNGTASYLNKITANKLIKNFFCFFVFFFECRII